MDKEKNSGKRLSKAKIVDFVFKNKDHPQNIKNNSAKTDNKTRQRVGEEWSKVRNECINLFDASIFVEKYQTITNFVNFATNEEVKQLIESETN